MFDVPLVNGISLQHYGGAARVSACSTPRRSVVCGVEEKSLAKFGAEVLLIAV